LIRKANLQDIDAIEQSYLSLLAHEAATHSYTNWKPGIYPTRETALDGLAEGTLYVLEESGRVRASMILNQHQAEQYAKIDWRYPAAEEEVLVVHTLSMAPEESGRGYGTQMVHFAMDTAREMGCRVIRLDTYVGNEPAIAMYQKNGFCISGRALVRHHGLFDSELYYLERQL